MSAQQNRNNWPKLHNAMWPGLVGKGAPGAEPCIDLDTMLEMTAAAEVDGIKFEGVDLFLFAPHIDIDLSDDGIKALAEKVRAKNFVVGSVVAPVWPPTGGGAAMGNEEERRRFVEQVRKACRIAKRLRELGARPYGIVRIDSASGVADWAQEPEANQKKIAQTFLEACTVAEDFGERLAAEGEICWGGMHSWRKMVDLLERVNRPKTLGFQADMAHTLLYLLGYNAPEDAILPAGWDWSDPQRIDSALQTLATALRPWTVDFHVAQNDGTVAGSGTHDKTGHHCLPNDPAGKLDIAHHAGYWLRAENGQPTRAFRHVCWDGCMFPNEVMLKQETWNTILQNMITVRDAHGWREAETLPTKAQEAPRQAATLTPGSKPPRHTDARPPSRRKVKKPVRKAARSLSGKRSGRRALSKVKPRKTRPVRKRPPKASMARAGKSRKQKRQGSRDH